MFDTLWLYAVNNAKSLGMFAAVLVLMEAAWPAKKDQKLWRRDSSLDLMYSFLMPALVVPLIAVPLGWLSDGFVGKDLFAAAQARPGSITLRIDVHPRNGNLQLQPQGFTFTPQPGFTGMDAFTVSASDGDSTLTRSFMASVEPPGAEDREKAPRIYFARTQEVWSGKAGEGAAGFFLRLRDAIRALPLWSQILLAVFVVDFVGYWRHRFQHLPGLWLFHSIHHCSKQVDWLSTERFHYVDQVSTLLAEQAACLLLFNDFYVLSASHFLRRGYGLLIHANLRWSFGALDRVFVSPLVHRWHHADDARAADKNYATFFSFLDVVFGTFYLPREKADPPAFGVYRRVLPENFIGQFVYPFAQLRPRRNPVES